MNSLRLVCQRWLLLLAASLTGTAAAAPLDALAPDTPIYDPIAGVLEVFCARNAGPAGNGYPAALSFTATMSAESVLAVDLASVTPVPTPAGT